jgi:DNA-binding MarR family transcriptional regulator
MQDERGDAPVEFSATARLIELVARRIYDHDGRSQLPPGQWAILRFLGLSRSDRSLLEVAHYLGMDVKPTQWAVASLKRKQLVLTTSNGCIEADRVSLSETGRSLLLDDPVGRVEQLLAVLSAEKQEMLAELIECMLDGPSPNTSQ